MKLPLLQVETERLSIRPFQKEDYKSWLDGFQMRLPAQYKYDDGYHDMSSSTKEWFTEWIRGFDEAAHRDEMYVLGIFRKEDGANIGKLELYYKIFKKVRRKENEDYKRISLRCIYE